MKSYSVIWTERAIESLRDIYEFIRASSLKRSHQLITDLVSVGNSLNSLPYRFPIEPLLVDEPIAYRFVAYSPYKLIYTISGESVMIVDVFDTRQEPDKLKIER